jgi:3-oxoacyl-[acyl-carrier-protein] synthase III
MPGRRGVWLLRQAPQIMGDAIACTVATEMNSGRLAGERVSHVVPHQPNGLILSRLQKQLGPGDVKVWNCIENTGNTLSASIPMAMSEV